MSTSPAVPPSSALDLEGVTRTFGKLRALDGTTLSIPKRSIFGLVGPNGAGKTTLFSVIAGFLQPDAGRIEILDGLAPGDSRLLGRMSILPQDALFDRNMTIVDQLMLLRRLEGASRRNARLEVAEALTRVGLGDYLERGVSVLSHGMSKRLGIVQAFLGDPELIFLDEPTSGLDPRNAKRVREVIRELSVHATVVVSSHNLFELQDLCDHVAILDRGVVKAQGSMSEITRGARRLEIELERTLVGEERAAIEALAGVRVAEDLGGGRYIFPLEAIENEQGNRTVRAILGELLRREITPRSFREGSSLEEIFLQLTDDTSE